MNDDLDNPMVAPGRTRVIFEMACSNPICPVYRRTQLAPGHTENDTGAGVLDNESCPTCGEDLNNANETAPPLLDLLEQMIAMLGGDDVNDEESDRRDRFDTAVVAFADAAGIDLSALAQGKKTRKLP